ncbi:hypothetical protein CPI12_03785 [Moraxella catarrhalis]|nr:hypothetical protein [Moraxella catarrhalis]MPX46092.1 hypothetical protein [Moraxella catarrhalis]MPX87200.1 hypothetical protein [Moraxella catarrhalis]RKM31949.1 hypothetical protein D6D86_02735 [Moraxella catarrhalis]
MVYFTASAFIFQRKFDANKLGLLNSTFIPNKPQRFYLLGVYFNDKHLPTDKSAISSDNINQIQADAPLHLIYELLAFLDQYKHQSYLC